MNNSYGIKYFEQAQEGGEQGGGQETSESSEAQSQGDEQESQGQESQEQAKPYFSEMPEDWRDQIVQSTGMTKDDEGYEARLNQLSRVSDIGSFAKIHFDAQDKIRKGLISSGLPDDATEEQLQSYREANGIPETPADYKLDLAEGLVLSDKDEGLMSSVYDFAHGKNLDSGTVSGLANIVLMANQAENQRVIDQDGVDKIATNKMLKETWGPNAETNTNLVRGLVNQLPEGIQEHFASARMSDGRALFNSPEVMVSMAEWAAKINPSATVVPNSNNPMQTINDEIATLEKRMGEPGWHKDTKAQKRYQALVNAQTDMK